MGDRVHCRAQALTDPDASNPARSLRTAAVRAALLVAIIVAGIAATHWTPVGDWLSEEHIVEFLEGIRDAPWAPIVLLLLYSVLAPTGISMVPLIVAGSIFGPAAGSLYNSAGLIIGASTSFWLARTLGRDFVTRVSGDRLRRAERLFNRHGFWPLVQSRFLPLPFPVVNFGAAMAGVDAGRFFVAAVLGLVPSTVIHSYFISQLIYVPGPERVRYGVAYGLAFVAFNLLIGVPWLFAMIKRRARFREKLALREARSKLQAG